MYEIHHISNELLSCEHSDWYRHKNRASGSCVVVSFVSVNVVIIMDGCAPRLSGRNIARRRGRLQRSERVSEPPAPHFAWDIIIRDSLLQIAWPMSLSADTDHQSADNGNVKLRWVNGCTLLQLSMCMRRDEVGGNELGEIIQWGASWMVEWKRNLMAHGDAREEKWRGKRRMEWVASSLALHLNAVYPTLLPLMRTPRLPAADWTDTPADINGLVRFAGRPILVSARVPSHSVFTLLSTDCYWRDNQEEWDGCATWHITVYTRCWLGTSEGKRQLKDLGVNVRIILKKSVGRTRTRLMWYIGATVGGLLWKR